MFVIAGTSDKLNDCRAVGIDSGNPENPEERTGVFSRKRIAPGNAGRDLIEFKSHNVLRQRYF